MSAPWAKSCFQYFQLLSLKREKGWWEPSRLEPSRTCQLLQGAWHIAKPSPPLELSFPATDLEDRILPLIPASNTRAQSLAAPWRPAGAMCLVSDSFKRGWQLHTGLLWATLQWFVRALHLPWSCWREASCDRPSFDFWVMQFSVSRPQAVKTGSCSTPVTRAAEIIKPVTIIMAFLIFQQTLANCWTPWCKEVGEASQIPYKRWDNRAFVKEPSCSFALGRAMSGSGCEPAEGKEIFPVGKPCASKQFYLLLNNGTSCY